MEIQRVASREAEKLRLELSVFFQGPHYQNQCTTGKSGASESSLGILQLRQARDNLSQLHVRARFVSSANLQLRRMQAERKLAQDEVVH